MYKKKVVILTGNELRHQFFRKAISSDHNIEVLVSICEDTQLSLLNRTQKQDFNDIKEKEIMISHIRQRENSERDFFSAFIELIPDRSNPCIIPKGDINKTEVVEKILSLKPDIIVVYGASLLKGKLVDIYGKKNKIVNIHLGISPYYRGSGTNFWALVNKQPECVGTTFMFLDSGIDSGMIIHQIRARFYENDTPHTIGNRLIVDTTFSCIKLIKNIEKISFKTTNKAKGLLCKRSDFTPESVKTLYSNFRSDMISEYIRNKNYRDSLFPIVTSDFV